jgi:hypothetical protein
MRVGISSLNLSPELLERLATEEDLEILLRQQSQASILPSSESSTIENNTSVLPTMISRSYEALSAEIPVDEETESYNNPTAPATTNFNSTDAINTTATINEGEEDNEQSDE